MTPKKTLKKWFSNFMKPAQEHFYAWLDSFWHKSEKIPMSSIEGLDRIVEGTASAGQLLNHINDTNAHRALLDRKVDKEEGKGLSTEDFTTEYKQKLQNLQPTDLQPLQEKITAIENTLAVDDTNLDTLQEIVTQVKANKNLEQLLTAKVDKEEGKGLSANDFTNPLKQKLETIGLFELKQGQYKFGQGEEVKKYYLTGGSDIDISALPVGSAIELYNFSESYCKIKVENFFGDLPFIGAKGSKVLLKKLQDGSVFIEHFKKDILVESFSKYGLTEFIKSEFNKETFISFFSSDFEKFCYVALPLTEEQKYSEKLYFSFEQNPVSKKTESNVSIGALGLSAIVLSPSAEGTDKMFKYTLNETLGYSGSFEIYRPKFHNINYVLLVYKVQCTLIDFEGGSGSVSVVLNPPTITGKKTF